MDAKRNMSAQKEEFWTLELNLQEGIIALLIYSLYLCLCVCACTKSKKNHTKKAVVVVKMRYRRLGIGNGNYLFTGKCARPRGRRKIPEQQKNRCYLRASHGHPGGVWRLRDFVFLPAFLFLLLARTSRTLIKVGSFILYLPTL